ncbi:MAG TPA: hypothetical protein PLH46_03310 [Caldisericia bacterium]|nr:hypothetical protein [Caldisericia bacterium]
MSYKSITTFDYKFEKDNVGDLLLLKVYADLLENKLGDFVAFDLKNYFLKQYRNFDENILEIGLEIENYRYLSSKSKNSGYFDLYYYRLNRNKK